MYNLVAVARLLTRVGKLDGWDWTLGRDGTNAFAVGTFKPNARIAISCSNENMALFILKFEWRVFRF